MKYSLAVYLVAFALAGCGPETSAPPVDVADSKDSDVEVRDMGTQTDTSVSTDEGVSPQPDLTSSMDTDTSEPDAGGPDCDAPFQPVSNPPDSPPFAGTAYITSDLITSADPSAFVDLTYDGQASRTMYDRRVAQFITVNAHLFSAQFGTTQTVEVRVNPEFSRADAETEARRFSTIIGQIPAFLMRDVDTISINAGAQDFGGGNGTS